MSALYDCWVPGKNGSKFLATWNPRTGYTLIRKPIKGAVSKSVNAISWRDVKRVALSKAHHFTKQEMEELQLRWITFHPSGDKEDEGVPILVHDDGEHYTVVGGARGRLNGTVYTKPKEHEKADEAEGKAKPKRKRRWDAAPEDETEEERQYREGTREKVAVLAHKRKETRERMHAVAERLVGKQMSETQAVEQERALARRRWREEHPEASEEEGKEAEDAAAVQGKRNYRKVVEGVSEKLALQAMERRGMQVLNGAAADEEVTPEEFREMVAGQEVAVRPTREDEDELLSLGTSLADVEREMRRLRASVRRGGQRAVDGIEAALARTDPSQEQVDEWARKGYLERTSALAMTALVRAGGEATPQARARHGNGGAADAINGMVAELTGETVVSPSLVKEIGVEGAARVAAAHLRQRGKLAEGAQAAEEARDRIAERGWIDACAVLDRVREAAAVAENARKMARSGDGTVTQAQASIQTMRAAQVAYRLTNVALGGLRGTQALAEELVRPSGGGLVLDGGASRVDARSRAESLGLEEGDYQVTGKKGGYKVAVAPEALHKLAQPRALREARRVRAMEEAREHAQEHAEGYHVDGMREGTSWIGPHQVEAIEALKRNKRVIVAHGAGCVAADTVIYDPVRGLSMTVKGWMGAGLAPWVWALTKDGEAALAQASVPFTKPAALMYRVSLENGAWARVSGRHMLLTPTGWRVLDALQPGQLVAVPSTASSPPRSGVCGLLTGASRCGHGLLSAAGPDLAAAASPCSVGVPSLTLPVFGAFHPPSNGGNAPEAPTPGGPRSDRTLPGSGDRCSRDPRPCGGRPPTGEEVARVPLPSRGGVLERSPLGSRSGGSVKGRKRNRPCPSLAPLATPGFETPAAHLTARRTGPRDVYASNIQSGEALQGHRLSLDLSALPRPTGGSGPRAGQAVTSAPFTSCPHYSTGWVKVTSVEYEGEEVVYDLTVPEHECYLAQGMWHHNTGKTSEEYGMIAALLPAMLDSQGGAAPLARRGVLIMPAKPRAQQKDFVQARLDEQGNPTGETETVEGEAKRFLSPEMAARVVTPKDGKQLRRMVASGELEGKVLLLSPEMVRDHADALVEGGFGGEDSFILADEAHLLATGETEGDGTMRARAAKRLVEHAGHVALLSGTPMESHPSELYDMVEMVSPPDAQGRRTHSLGSREQFVGEWQRLAQTPGTFARATKARMRERLAGVMTSHYSDPTRPAPGGGREPVRVTRETRTVGLSPQQRTRIAAANARYREARQSENPDRRRNAVLMRNNAMEDILYGGSADPESPQYNPKFTELRSVIEQARRENPGARIVVYSDKLFPHRGAEQVLREFGDVVHVTGEDDDDAVRSAMQRLNNPSTSVGSALLSSAGNFGLNAQGAIVLVKLHVIDTPSREDQVDHRIFRHGQTRDCKVYTLVSEHPFEQARLFRSRSVKGRDIKLMEELARGDEGEASSALAEDLPRLERLAGLKLEDAGKPVGKALALRKAREFSYRCLASEAWAGLIRAAKKDGGVEFDRENDDPVGEPRVIEVPQDEWEFTRCRFLCQMWSAGGDWEVPARYFRCQLVEGYADGVQKYRGDGLLVYIPGKTEGNAHLLPGRRQGEWHVPGNDTYKDGIDPEPDERACWRSLREHLKGLVDREVARVRVANGEGEPEPEGAPEQSVSKGARLVLRKAYDPSEPRVPAGQPGAGEWTARRLRSDRSSLNHKAYRELRARIGEARCKELERLLADTVDATFSFMRRSEILQLPVNLIRDGMRNSIGSVISGGYVKTDDEAMVVRSFARRRYEEYLVAGGIIPAEKGA